MGRFLYYFPGVCGMNPRMLGKFGCLDRFTASGGKLIAHGVTAVNDGPAAMGCIVAAGAEPPRAVSGWQRSEVSGQRSEISGQDLRTPTSDFWVALEDPAQPPGPDDLERDVGLAGYRQVLGDGNAWRVPLVHRWDAASERHVPAVPSSLQICGGKIGRRIRPEYAAVDAIAARTFEAFYLGKSFPAEALFADAAALLAVNYRLGMPEINLLGLIQDETALIHLLAASIDCPALERAAAEADCQGLYYSEHEAAVAEGAD